MKICSIDIETTGDNPNLHDILSIGFIIADLKKSKIVIDKFFNHVFFKENLNIKNSVYSMHKDFLNWYFENFKKDVGYTYYTEIYYWLDYNLVPFPKDEQILLIGKNYNKFDKMFILEHLKKNEYHELDEMSNVVNIINQTAYDIGIACMDLNNDTTIPKTEECLKRLNIKYNPEIRHNSLYDSWLMLQAFSKVNNFEIINPILDESIFGDYEVKYDNLHRL